jgi:hypothetical protein
MISPSPDSVNETLFSFEFDELATRKQDRL